MSKLDRPMPSESLAGDTDGTEETDNLRLITEEKSDWGSSKSKYKGRGMFQLTGSSNNKKFGEYCKTLGHEIDFVS